MKLADIAQRVSSDVDCALDGDGAIEIHGLATLDEAGPEQLAFLSNPRYAAKVKQTRAGALILPKEFGPVGKPSLRSSNPYLCFARALELFYQPPRPAPGIHPTAVVAPTARLGQGASVGPYVVVEDDVVIGDRAVLHPFVCIYRGARIGHDFTAHSHAVVREFCRLGDRVTLQNGAVVGCDGYGFAKREDGSYSKIVQSGIAVIEDDVEVQAHSCVDRATLGETRIRRGAKLDNLVQVGHSSTVGRDVLLCAQVGLAGSTEVGDGVVLAGQVGVAGHCKIGAGASATAQSGIPNDVPPGQMVSGYPAIENRLWLKCSVAFQRLPELLKTVRQLRGEVERLKEKVAGML